MKQRCLFSILCFFLISFGVCSVSAQTCSEDKGTFIPYSTYDVNRRLILTSLPSNVIAQDGLFYNGSMGDEPNRVYAIGMCIPGSTLDGCSNCIESASKEVSQNCPNQTEAYLWRGDPTFCHLRYSNNSFLGSADLNPVYFLLNPRDVDSNPTEFRRIWEDLMGSMIEAASTAKSTPSFSSNHYKADIAALTSKVNIYALMQCTPDLTSRECENCLQQSKTYNETCCGYKRGAVVMRPSCYLRWEVYEYSNAFNNPSQTPTIVPQPAGDQANTTNNDSKGISPGTVVTISIASATVLILLVLGFFLWRRRKSFDITQIERRSKTTYGTEPPDDSADDITTSGSLQFDFKAIEAATNNFQMSNKLGHGGFGEVYKGTFPNGTEVAVKRLSKTSGQGEQEFKNEVLLVAKLQHRNLVRLLGFSVEGEERILVYEFVPNKSLDHFLVDPAKRSELDWRKRFNIIGGITRGILYLHQDSRLTIIHRDLKASNILLDTNMNPKIADFGMARNFRVDQTEENTGRIVGTFGYMPPEYVANGQFSMKTDVYSFGVLIMEIIVGKKSSCFHQMDGSVGNLVTYVWRFWNNKSLVELIDSEMGEVYDKDEVIRCIHIGLLCVQENPTDRPTMSTVFQMLTNPSIALPIPQPPGFVFGVRSSQPGSAALMSFACSVDDATITTVNPR